MTPAEYPAFVRAFNRLSIQGVLSATDKVAKDAYFRTLSDLPLWTVEAAADYFCKKPVRFFTSAIWHEHAYGLWVAQRREDRQRRASQRVLEEHCHRCKDSGMRESETDATRLTHCECTTTNPNYQARKAHDEILAESNAEPMPRDDAGRLLETIEQRDFKRLGSGE